MHVDRRALLAGLGAVLASPCAGGAGDATDIPLGDMHAHLFFVGPKPADRQPMRPNMESGRASLVSWSLVGDMPWIRPTQAGLKQTGAPEPGSAMRWFESELARVMDHLSQQKLKLVRKPSDLDKAVAGDPHVVLSVEGATFLEDGIGGLERAHAAGVRHLQLVHYVRNTIGDFQTEAPANGGLTAFGRQVIQEANRLGILVDLAHMTSSGVRQALEVSKAPMVWSHSSVVAGEPHWRMVPWRARQLSVADARAIAGKGGVIGLWALPSDVGKSVEAYAERLLEMSVLLGDDHVGFGTDMNALANSPIKRYADLRRAVEHMAKRGAGRSRLEKIAIGNYARVLRQAMTST